MPKCGRWPFHIDCNRKWKWQHKLYQEAACRFSAWGENSFLKKCSFKGGESFHFRGPYLSTEESNFFCSWVDVLWHSRARTFPQLRIEEGYLTRKKKNCNCPLLSCNILFFVFQFLCSILAHIPETKRWKKYTQIAFHFFLSGSPVESPSPPEASWSCGALYCLPQCCRIIIWKRLHKNQVNILLQETVKHCYRQVIGHKSSVSSKWISH